MIWVGIFLVVNGVLDLNLARKTNGAGDLLFAIAGITLGTLVLTGTLH